MDQQPAVPIRLDYRVIVDLIEPNSRVLDMGCGGGELLALLIKRKSCRGTGIEIDEKAIYSCVAKGLTVSHGDINSGLTDYADKRFDYVILNESLQQILQPQKAILEALRVGKKVIVGIPNFCHIQARFQIFFRGKVPVTKELPYEWYNTPNLRFFSLKDFKEFCKINGIAILNQKAVDAKKEVTFLPNLFAHIGIFLLEK
jgi:methionine biosynthesis protein MetW